MLDAVGSGVTSVIGWIGDVVSALTTTDGALAPLLPLLAVGVAVTAVSFAFSAVRNVIWGA